jgi:hypothetical protein
MQQTPEVLKKKSEKMKERWLQGEFVGVFDSDEARKANSERMKGKSNASGKREQAFRDKMSIIATQRWKDGEFDNDEWNESHTPNGYCKPGKYGNIYMLSKVERRYAFILDQLQIRWEYEPKRFWIEELGCSYTPDFHLIDSDEWKETKFKVKETPAKVEALKRMGYNITLVQDKDIKELERMIGRSYEE